MEPANNNLSPLSSKGKWDMMFFDNNYNAQSHNKKFLKTIPYEVFDKIANKLEPHWEEYGPQIQKVLNQMGQNVDTNTSWSFMRNLCLGNMQIRVENLLKIADRIHDTSIKKYLTLTEKRAAKSVEREQDRLQSNNDASKGFLSDLSEETIMELAARIGENQFWKRMGDGFGFGLQKCLEFPTPKEMLKEWMKFEPKATVCRLHFEAKRLGFNAICNYLDAIPLEGVAKIDFFPIDNAPLFRYATRFDMKRLNEIFASAKLKADWESAAELIFRLDKNSKSSVDDLWRAGNIYLGKLLGNLSKFCKPQVKECIEIFEEEVKDGSFEPVSSGGITFSQIKFLSQAISNNLDTLHTLELKKKNDPLLAFGQLNKFYHDLGKHLPQVQRDGNMTAERFLCLYWQCNDDKNLDALCGEIIKILRGHSYQMANAFQECYLSIKPFRSYDSRLAEKNRNQNSKGISIKVDNASQEVIGKKDVVKDQDLCKICFEKQIKWVPVPCGHLAFCLECIASMDNCAICQKGINLKVEIFYS